MELISLIGFVWIIVPASTQINLALHKNTNQSSNLDSRSLSSLAVDGCLNQQYSCRLHCGDPATYHLVCCAHQALGQSYAWWSVDLGQLSEISHIVVYLRQDYTNARTRRFVLRVSNESDPQSGEVCFHDTNYNLNDVIVNITTCKNKPATHIHFTNYKSQTNVLLELCEVQVFGCPFGTFGKKCGNNCSSSCSGGRCNAYNGYCLACNYSEYLDISGLCQACPENCTSCNNASSCKACTGNLFLFGNEEENYCGKCPDNCLNCTNYKGCIDCVDNHYLNQSKCEICPPNCTLCFDEQGCSSCNNGFALENNMCVQCDEGCLNCNNSLTCFECQIGYFLLQDQCNFCPENCKQCSNDIVCEVCHDNFYKNQSGNCIRCADTCNNCTSKGCAECTTGFYGPRCNENCGFCKNQACNQTTGYCLESQCEGAYTGRKCINSISQSQPEKSVGSFIGGAIGGIAVVFISSVIIYILVIKKRKNSCSEDKTQALYTDASAPRGSLTYDEGKNYSNEQFVKQEETYYNIGNLGIPVSRFKHMVKIKLENKAEDLRDEFKAYEETKEPPCEIAKLEKNKDKNRFKQIFAYDHSRVVLNNGEENDYINANYIDNVEKPRVYIATQGPKKNTLNDFWQMIWQEQCDKIIMLTNLKEGLKTKCEQYWPDEEQLLELTDFDIELLSNREYGFYVIRSIKVKQKKTQQEREIQQFHFTAWPDHGTPEAIEIVLFHRRVSLYPSKHLGPMCVHCSAGVGRTGTYIGLDALLSYGRISGYVDVPSFFRKMRGKRMLMIQNEDQYVALHEILLEAFNIENTLIQKSKYYGTLEDMRKSDSLLQEFQKLQNLNSDNDETNHLTAEQNKNKIILPSDATNVKNNIEVILAPTYRSRNGFMLTQFPTLDNVKQFWHMMVDYGCETIIILAEKTELEQIKLFMPTNGAIDTGRLYIQNKWHDDVDGVGVTVTNKNLKSSSEIKAFYSTDWNTSVPLPTSFSNILQLVDKVDIREQKYGSDSPTVVMSRDGISKVGAFCLLYNTTNQLQMDEEVDVFQTARQLQIRSSSFISSFEEYEFCYNALQEYLNMTDVYMNT